MGSLDQEMMTLQATAQAAISLATIAKDNMLTAVVGALDDQDKVEGLGRHEVRAALEDDTGDRFETDDEELEEGEPVKVDGRSNDLAGVAEWVYGVTGATAPFTDAAGGFTEDELTLPDER